MASVTLSVHSTQENAKRSGGRRSQHPFIQALWRLVTNPMGAIGLIIICLTVLVALFAPDLAPFDPTEQIVGDELLPPGRPYWLGTDEFGRDLLSRLLFGTRISLSVALVAVGLGAGIGITTGLVSGYFGGWIDTFFMRIWDVLLAYPAILIGIAIVAVLGPSTMNAAYALAIVNIPEFSRLMRASVLTQREREYVLSAQCIGVPSWRIIGRHLLPNCISPILVQLSLAMGFAILLEAGLSFLGLGAQPPTPSWGAMLNDSRNYLRQAWWYGVYPGAALAVLVFGLNSLTDGLRDALDPHKLDK